MLYEAATIGDIYLAYEQLKIDDDSLFSCIGVAGAQAGEEILGKDFLSFYFFQCSLSNAKESGKRRSIKSIYYHITF